MHWVSRLNTRPLLLTLPVSAAYLVVGILMDLPRPPWPREFSFGGLTHAARTPCGSGGFGVSTGTEWVAVILSVVNGFILPMAVCAVRWLYPARTRARIAVAAGTLFGLVGAAVTHG